LSLLGVGQNESLKILPNSFIVSVKVISFLFDTLGLSNLSLNLSSIEFASSYFSSISSE